VYFAQRDYCLLRSSLFGRIVVVYLHDIKWSSYWQTHNIYTYLLYTCIYAYMCIIIQEMYQNTTARHTLSSQKALG
jgi:hypothetical protein